MQRNKTQRKRMVPTPTPETPGPFMSDNVAKTTEDSLDAFLFADQVTFNQPWQRLDRGARLDRLRKFVQSYPNLTQAETASLLAAILQAFETRQLNTKLAVEYDPQTAKITAIRGLKERVGLSGLKTFRIDGGAMRATIRRSKSTLKDPKDLTLKDQKDEAPQINPQPTINEGTA
jgi:hypothetical protein